MNDIQALSAAVYSAISKAYDHECDIEEAADAVLEIIEADRKRRGGPVVLMREAALHLTNWLDKDECECEGPGHYCGRTQVERCRDRLLDASPQPAEPGGYVHTVPDDCETLHWRGQILNLNELATISADPVKPHLSVSYDDKYDCLYVDCNDSDEPIDADEDDKGVLYRYAASDGRLIGVTIMNFMGQHAKYSHDTQRPAKPVKGPSNAISVVGVPEFDALMDHIYENGTASEGVLPLANAFARALLARYGKGAP